MRGRRIVFDGKHCGSQSLRKDSHIKIFNRGRVEVHCTGGSWRQIIGEGEVIASELEHRIAILDTERTPEGTYWIDFMNETSIRELLSIAYKYERLKEKS